MIDSAHIYLKAGDGGNGSINSHREKFVPYGGPDGGDGGDGGSIYLCGDENESTLLKFEYRRKYKASGGGNGTRSRRRGKKGDDIELTVPVGTEVWLDGDEMLVDITASGQRVLVVKGGSGGRGNAGFATPTNRFPLLAEAGDPGGSVSIRLEMKFLADVGIVGAPNAGKSSLLAAVSNARPKIGDYPFTTTEPVLGVVDYRHVTFVMADIPGLVEDAHKGVGLGHRFLKHAQRTRALVHVVDGTVDDPVDEYKTVKGELELFDRSLAGRSEIVVLSKVDLPEVERRVGEVRASFRRHGVEVRSISAVTGEGLSELVGELGEMLSEGAHRGQDDKVRKEPVRVPVLRPEPAQQGVSVERAGGVFVVRSRAAARISEMIEARNPLAVAQFHQQLIYLGVVRALERAGVKAGDRVRTGKLEWRWE